MITLIYATFVLIILIPLLTNKLLQRLAESRFVRENGCKELKMSPTQLPLGIDFMWKLLATHKYGGEAQLFRTLFRQNGNTFQIRLIEKLLVTCEPRNLHAMLANQFDDFELGNRRYKALSPLMGDSIFTADGAAWKTWRTLLRPNFARHQVVDVGLYEKHVSSLLSLIPDNGSTVDLQPLFFRMTLDSATEFLLGESVNSLTQSEHKFSQDFDLAQRGSVLRLRLGPCYFLMRDKSIMTATLNTRKHIEAIAKKAVQDSASLSEKNKKPNDNFVFLHELIQQTTDLTVLTDQLVSILVAGRDTTASLLSSVFHVLARRTDVWTKLKEEVTRLDGQQPSYETLHSMTYLQWVIKETLRLYPSVPVNSREATRQTMLPVGGGPNGDEPILVRKGQTIQYCVWAMHRLTEIYGPDADEFRPERWETLRPKWEYLPFNGGPRICPGQQFALTEASYVITRLVQSFAHIESRDSDDYRELWSLIMSCRNGTKVALKK